ncbi:type VII secretion protein EccCa [Mycobacteroides abscessus]|uniref:type VII secretion protein EccCa n=1 Tax=Mycobacteroides abscessus TaxID=36809 RepID=UPI0005DC886E|nr:type VII secretion protein EccCa [Mycobacteroides abscessus]RIS73224.1 type VII secretion protein EccCa [Mycobacteroides abscessus]RIT40457.1 type VII secretion protein EccCa [Mycobacteroides abscessus]CPX10647.1 Putative FtsK/SpoIIIE family protein [Mycobacteroides abscessus]SKG94044.1 ESX-3 secretion system protein EccC3 [Mycobacteroides abscessus subsp. massiliense]SKH42949.1 ESX-3 secretion system protein EccC3 [Mycobacteroides abscessus subsp. massiliense]
MSRLIFEPHRRVAPPAVPDATVTVEAPPQLPRVVPPSFLRRAMPVVIVILIVGMVVALVASGIRLISPQTLFFPFVLLLAATALYRGGGDKVRTEEVDAERADYLRYLSVVRENLRTHATAQRKALEWSHPDPEELTTVPGSRRQWERDPGDDDYLVVRAGRHDVPLASPVRVKDIADEIDLEPVSHSALRGLLDTQRTVRSAPLGIDLNKVSRITVFGDDDIARAAIRSWVAQAVTFHDPTLLTVAMAGPGVEDAEWSWLKWLPHVDISGEVDGVGPARYLRRTGAELFEALTPVLTERELFGADSGAHKHLLIILDDPAYDLNGVNSPIPATGLDGVTVIQRLDGADGTTKLPDYLNPERPVLQVNRNGVSARITRWNGNDWQPYVDEADQLTIGTASHVARRLSRWDSNPTHPGLRSAATGGATFTSLLGIEDASQLDVPALWSPRSRDEELRVPIGVTSSGEPLMFDLKDEAEGGMGPHGLMIGMTGSGKSQTLMSILLSLLATHSADRLIVIYADFKGEAGADIFRDFPQVVAVISNMAEKRSLADRFADTLRGEVARRENLLKQAGRDVQGSAFNSVREYEEAIAAGHDLPPIPTLFVVADEFTLMLQDHPEYAELFDYVARKGRSFRIHILFASQTLDVGKIKDIDKNTSYRIGLKVASPSASRQIIGTEDAYHIESGKDHKGVGFLVPAPGAVPIKFRSTYVDGIYEPPSTTTTVEIRATPQPKQFTALPVAADPTAVIVKGGSDRPAQPARKLISTVGDQLAKVGPRAPQLWLPPLDTAIPLASVLDETGLPARQLRWPLGEIDKPFQMRRDPLIFDATSAAGNVIIHGGPKSGKSTALQTFMLSAAALHSPRDVTFYCIDYGGGQLHALDGLAHVGSVASALEPERIRRTFGELEQLLAYRQRLFRDRGIASVSQLRALRDSDRTLDDGYGETFLIVDNLYAFSRDNTDQFNTRNPLLARLTELANAGLSYGIHVVITTPNWIEVPLAMRDSLGLRLELKLHDSADSNVRVPGALRRPAESVPHDQPGRGLTMHAEHFLFAASDAKTVDSVNASYPGAKAPAVRLLPADLAPGAIGPLYPGREQVVIGQREQDLAPVALDFSHNPLLMVLGDTGSGKTTLLRHIIRTVREHSTPDQVAFTVLDRRLHLVDEPLFPENEYTPNIDRITPAMLGLGALLEKRRPPAGLSPEELHNWVSRGVTAQRHYLIIDDVDQIPDAPAVSGPYIGQRPWNPITGLLAEARELGLRVIITARATGSGHILMTNPMLRRFHELQANTLMLSGSPQDGGRIRGHRFERLPAGRGILLSDNDVPTYVQTVNPLVSEHAAQGREYPR